MVRIEKPSGTCCRPDWLGVHYMGPDETHGRMDPHSPAQNQTAGIYQTNPSGHWRSSETMCYVHVKFQYLGIINMRKQ